MMCAAAAVLIQHSNWLLSRCGAFGYSCRSMATQTASAAAHSIPWLVATSPSNLESRYLYTLTKGVSSSLSSRGSIDLKLDRELILPEISRNWIIGSSHGYLITMPVSRGVPRDIHVVNPITGALRRIPITSNLFVVHVKSCKAILSPSLDKVALLPTCYSRAIGLASLSSSSTSPPSWTILKLPHHDMLREVHDCIFHKDCLYVTNKYPAVGVIHTGIPVNCPLIWTNICKQNVNERHDKSMLVESPGGDDLYLLVRTTNKYQRFRFKVFKLDHGHWENVESIGDHAMFVARNNAMLIRTHDSPVLKPNCVYFFGDNFCYEPNHNVGIYYLKSKRFKPIGVSDDECILTSPHPPPILLQPMT